MSCTGICVAFLKPLLLFGLGIALLPLIPNLPPHHSFSSFSVPPPPSLKGKYALNSALNEAERLFEHEIVGPECFAILNGELYTTLHGGHVVKIVGDSIEPVIKFGLPCRDRSEEAKCGRPLGIFAGPDDLLYIADAYYGVYTFNVQSGKKEKLFGPEDNIAGRAAKLFNSISLANDGTIYWTDSTSDVTLEDGLFSLLSDGTGRLLKYSPKTKEHTVLIDGLLFANGVALAADESFVIVAETGKSRIHRYWISGPKAGQSDLFVDNLPGLPDNLRSGAEGFLVSLVLAADDNNPILIQSIYPFPYIKKIIARVLALTELALKTINFYYPNSICTHGVHLVGHFEMGKFLYPPRVTLITFDFEGHVRDSFHATDGSVTSISDAIIYRGDLYLGSPYNHYLGRVRNADTVARFQKSFPVTPQVTVRIKSESKHSTTHQPEATTRKPARTTTAKPKTATPKPTTTTPKPITTTTTRKPITTTTTPKPVTTTTTPKPKTATPKPVTTNTTPKPAHTTSKSIPSTPSPVTATKPSPKPTKPTHSDTDSTHIPKARNPHSQHNEL